MRQRVEILKRKFVQRAGLPFREVLSEASIESALAEEKVRYRNRLYTPIVTIWAFLSQVLESDQSLANTVKRVQAWLVSAGAEPPSSQTGGYTKARQRLPERLLKRLLSQTGSELDQQVEAEDLWCGRVVKLLDGSSVLMPDTQKNQAEYPQHSNQKPGCGFPIIKLVVMFSLSTAAVIGLRIAALNTGEVSLARSLYETLDPDDVVLADRAYGTYVDLALVQQKGADGVFRKHQSRKSDFRRSKRLGKGDQIVTWSRPSRCPDSLAPAEFESLPRTLTVREVKFSVPQKGFRTQSLIVVTTLLDPKEYAKSKLAQLYGLRWQAEVNLDHIKTTLGMEMVRGKTPAMVRKEIYVYLMAYNLLRALMWKAGKKHGVSPLRLSVQGTRQSFNQFCPLLAEAGRIRQQPLILELLSLTAESKIPLRPGRSEPRKRKRRPKAFPLMTKPRSVLKQELGAA